MAFNLKAVLKGSNFRRIKSKIRLNILHENLIQTAHLWPIWLLGTSRLQFISPSTRSLLSCTVNSIKPIEGPLLIWSVEYQDKNDSFNGFNRTRPEKSSGSCERKLTTYSRKRVQCQSEHFSCYPSLLLTLYLFSFKLKLRDRLFKISII